MSAAASSSSSIVSPIRTRTSPSTSRAFSLSLSLDDELTLCSPFRRSELFEKVLFNLLGNAFKYTLHGTITVKVVYEGTTKALVQVIDTGCGIADHELAHIFDR